MGASDGMVKQLVLLCGDGNVGKRFNIMIVAEGYCDQDLATFESDAKDVLSKLTTSEPFKSNIKAFNVFRLDVVSNEAGADDGTELKATFFDAGFAAHPPQLLLVDSDLVENTVRDQLGFQDGTPAPVHKIVVLVNTQRRGGSGGIGESVSVSSRAHGASTVLHELGHTFALTDEYSSNSPDVTSISRSLADQDRKLERALDEASSSDAFWPNLALSFHREDLPPPWAALVKPDTRMPTVRHDGDGPIPADTVGAFPDLHSDYYRPQWACSMRHCEDSFCAVCINFITTQIQNSDS